METRYYWRPGYTVGPQFGEWQAHVDFLGVIHRVAHTKVIEQMKESG
jgi:hypothetical protein